MVIADWIKDISEEQLPEPYKSIAREIGLEGTLRLANLYQGTGFYLPKLDTLLAEIRNKRIREEFNGGNHRELARKYELTERWIYEIIGQTRDENQISLFPDNS